MYGLTQKFVSTVEYLSDAIARIFTPSKDDFPATGAQPYTGDRDREKTK